MADSHRLKLVSYNLHGLNQGSCYLKHLCDTCDVVFVQEHWLAPSELDRLHHISSDMIIYSCSAMANATSKGCLYGRPFGGLAVYVKINLATNAKLLKTADRYIILQFGQLLLINVYLPSVCTPCRDEEFIDCLACILNDVSDLSYSTIIFGGDMNVDFGSGNHLCVTLLKFAADLNLRFVDEKLPAGFITYRVDTTNATSAIDHLAVSATLYDDITDVQVLDSGINLSDHCALRLDVDIPVPVKSVTKQPRKRNKHLLSFRWDHGDLISYYGMTEELLSSITVPTFLLSDISFGLPMMDILNEVNRFYANIVNALYSASCVTIPRKKHDFYKFWWDAELDSLKDKAIRSFNLWSALGKPRCGVEFDCMRQDKRMYKMAIRSKERTANDQFSDSLNDALLTKDMDGFWSSWRSKFGKVQPSPVVEGLSDDKGIADRFASVFRSVCMPNSVERHQQLQTSFIERFSQYVGNVCDARIDVEIVSKYVGSLKKGKAAGIDCLTAEHILLAHPVLIVQLTLLFNMLLKHGLVPDGFGLGIVIPLLKNSDSDKTSAGNYRGITLSPIVSKLFELVLIALFNQQLSSHILQFGFKQHSSCSHALFTLKTVTEHYLKHGSTVTMCALDISKAFDRVDHYALLSRLMDRHLPKNFIALLLEWFQKCSVCVRWGSALSFWFGISAGVRQGGCLSPLLFAIYMDVLITRLKSSSFGCQLLGEYYGCLVYADDIMLLSHSVNAMRYMLKVCEDFALEFDVRFNSSKSVALRIGPRYDVKCEPLQLCGTALEFVQSVKYLGVYLVSAGKLKFSIEHLKIKFFRAFNCIYSRSRGANSELVTIELMKAYCLPYIVYATEAISLSATNVRILNNCINKVVYKIFGIGDSASLWLIRGFLGLSSVADMIERRRSRFMDSLLNNNNFNVLLRVHTMNLFV